MQLPARLAILGFVATLTVAGCDSSTPSLGELATETGSAVTPGAPTPVPPGSPSAIGWGPLAVVGPQDGSDGAQTLGTLIITETCVGLLTRSGETLLVWPSNRTTWEAGSKAVMFTNVDGATTRVRDGHRVSVGGSGDSNGDSGTTSAEWVAGIPWIQAPDASCPLERRWWVGALQLAP